MECLCRYPCHLSESATWPRLIKARADHPTLSHTQVQQIFFFLKKRKTPRAKKNCILLYRNTFTATRNYEKCSIAHTSTAIRPLPLDKDYSERFSLPHAHRKEGRLFVKALVPLESFCVCVHRFSFVSGCVIRGKRVKLHERAFKSLIFFYSVFWHLDDKPTEKRGCSDLAPKANRWKGALYFYCVLSFRVLATAKSSWLLDQQTLVGG